MLYIVAELLKVFMSFVLVLYIAVGSVAMGTWKPAV